MRTLLLTAAVLGLIPPSTAQRDAGPAAAGQTETKMTEARGTFEVKAAPLVSDAGEGTAANSLNKTYKGELDAVGKGQMLSAGDPASGTAGYVALERITGKLAGKTGTFALMQSGTMVKGAAPQLTVTIVPGSGTGDLSGIYGSMTITIAGGAHSYVLYYNFAAK